MGEAADDVGEFGNLGRGAEAGQIGRAQLADLALIVTPLAGLGATVAALARERPNLPFLWACKGIDPERLALPHRIVTEAWPETLLPPRAGVLTGPSFALEVARNLPTALVLAAADAHWAKHWVEQLHQPRLRLYAHDDVVGAEVGGALKNVIAIAAGVADGLGCGLNARAALITRGLAEIARLARAAGAQKRERRGKVIEHAPLYRESFASRASNRETFRSQQCLGIAKLRARLNQFGISMIPT